MQPHGGDRPAVKKGPWTSEEDEVLLRHVGENGPREWSSIRSKGLILRTGKSCRLRWVNKLRPNLKTGCKFSPEEERIVIDLQAQLGNKWAKIATYLPGRTDNDVKNFWSTRQKRLARLLREPLPGRKSGKNSSTTAPPPHQSPTPTTTPTPKDPPLQELYHHNSQCSQEPFPVPLGFEAAALPSPSSLEFAVDGAECSSSNTGPASGLPFGRSAHPVSGADLDHPGYGDVGSLDDDDAAFLEAQFFGLEDGGYDHVGHGHHHDTSEMFFDDLPAEMFDFLELPPLPPASPPPSPPPPPPPRPPPPRPPPPPQL